MNRINLISRGVFSGVGFVFAIVVGTVMLAVACFIAACFGGIDYDYSTGSRVGKLYKLSKKGIVWRTYEGELDLEMMETNEYGMSNKVWCFSVPDEKVAKGLEAIQGQRVKLIYNQKVIADFSKGGTSYHVTGFELLE